ncbi:PR domain zinc finger protein 14-like isoform X10 [Tachypleus tridentatus]|uniref:PR domain zinc finger protein 14-like isoform X10 n=1 Tax=Tachypleus tridentatus TaxID=6853 RepID=UPI003FD03BC3
MGTWTLLNNENRSLGYNCSLCHKSFRSYMSERMHFYHQHKSHRHFPCSSCGKVFTRKQNLMKHDYFCRNKIHYCSSQVIKFKY